MINNNFVFDTHVHIYGPMQTIWGYIGQTIDTWIERMDSNGIDMSQIMGDIAITNEEQIELNNVIIEACRKYPHRFIGFAWVSPMFGQKALDEMRRCSDEGLVGLKLYSGGHGYSYDSEIVNPIVELAQELGWVIMAHTDFDSKQSSPHQAIRLAKRFPDMKFLFAHVGMSPDLIRSIPDLVKDIPNIYLDTSDSPNQPEFVYSAPMHVMPDRVLFGSDAPTLSPEVELYKIEIAQQFYGLTDEEKRKVLGLNAARLFNIDISKNT